ncbi:MAG: hypothetical protein CMJ20_14420 [Phycisphaeraceae bacterium]|nr:hypothetical protein [Phycisphaeraceae bacterium]
MISLAIALIGLVLSIAILTNLPRVANATLRGLMILSALLVFTLFFWASSYRYVGEDSVGVVIRNIGSALPAGKIIATKGEKGPQAKILGPGWNPLLWPGIFTIEVFRVVEIREGEVGLLTTTDGLPLPPGEIYAPEWGQNNFQEMLRGDHFLADGNGYKGPQASVLTPGKYRMNPKVFRIETVPATNIAKATVGVVKSNIGDLDPDNQMKPNALVDRGQRGIWRQPLMPQIYYINTKAHEVTVISTEKKVVRYAKQGARGEEKEITVRSSDGFTFPVDVRVEYELEPENAALVVANFGDDGAVLLSRLNSAVRAIFRNNAETVKALDYVQQRSTQESQSLVMLANEMTKVGVTVTAVRIGDVGDVDTLGPLLKTQTDREIAIQQQTTFEEQQRTAEQQKDLTKTRQEAEEEKRLATASYEVDIAVKQNERQIIEAQAQAEAIRIRAEAQAEAYRVVAEQIGPGNAALVELLKIVGERGIQITPRVMVTGQSTGTGTSSETTALIGTMLDTMVSQTTTRNE